MSATGGTLRRSKLFDSNVSSSAILIASRLCCCVTSVNYSPAAKSKKNHDSIITFKTNYNYLIVLNGVLFIKSRVNVVQGRAMVQAVSRRPPTVEARVRSRVRLCGICGGRSGTGTGFSLSTSVFPCQFHSTGAPLLGKGQKIIIIIIITGLHNKPQGCGASVASAAGPFTTKKKSRVISLSLGVSRDVRVLYIIILCQFLRMIVRITGLCASLTHY
jgi:hypothetical protein